MDDIDAANAAGLQAELDLQQLKEVLEMQNDDSDNEDSDAYSSQDNSDGGAQEILNRFLASNVEDDEKENELNQDEGFSDAEVEGSSGTGEMALLLNQAYQQEIKSLLGAVEQAIIQNRTKQEEIREEIDEMLKNKVGGEKIKHAGDYKLTEFIDSAGLIPPPNSEAMQRKILKMAHNPRPVRNYRNRDTRKLCLAVALDSRKKRLQPHENRLVILQEKLNECDDLAERKQLRQNANQINREMRQIRSLTDEELLEDHDPEAVDWLKISATDFNGEFSWSSIRNSWVNMMQPSLSTSAWTPDEDEELLRIAEEHHYRDWASVAKQLPTRRSAFQCAQRYQTKYGKNALIRNWTREEDELLTEVVQSCRIGDHISWTQVSYFMEERSNSECCLRWRRVNPDVRHGHFDRTEDDLIRKAYNAFGPNWKKICQFVPNRTAIQVKERYMDKLRYDLNFADFSYEEDKKLVELCSSYKDKIPFMELTKQMPGRNDGMLHRRWDKLCQWRMENEWLSQQPIEVQSKLSALYGNKTKKTSEYRRTITNLHDLKHKMESSLLNQELEKGVFWSMSQPGSVEKVEAVSESYREELDKLGGVVGRMLEFNKSVKDNIFMKQVEDLRKMQEDLKKGVYVPRPILFLTNKPSSKSEDHHTSLAKSIRAEIKLKIDPKAPRGEQLKILANLLGTKSVQNQLKKLPNTDQLLEKMKKYRNTQLSAEIMSEVLRLCGTRLTVRNIGRPRTFLTGTYDRDEHEPYVSALLMDALKGDLSGICSRAARLRDRHVNRKMPSEPSDKEREDFVRRRDFLNDLCSSLHGISKVSKELKEESIEESSDDSNILRYFKEPSIYRDSDSIPFIPPNTTTLFAFKSLLLQRRSLLETAGDAYNPANSPLASLKRKHTTTGETSAKRARSEDTEVSLVDSVPGTSTDNQPLSVNVALEVASQNPSFETFVDRFVSLFAWPALLSTLKEDQEFYSEKRMPRQRTEEEEKKRLKIRQTRRNQYTKKAKNNLLIDKQSNDLKRRALHFIAKLRKKNLTEAERQQIQSELDKINDQKREYYTKREEEGKRPYYTKMRQERREAGVCKKPRKKYSGEIRRSSRVADVNITYHNVMPLSQIAIHRREKKSSKSEQNTE